MVKSKPKENEKLGNINQQIKDRILKNIKNSLPKEEITPPSFPNNLSPIQLNNEREITTQFPKKIDTPKKPKSGTRSPYRKLTQSNKLKLANHLSKLKLRS